MPSPFSGCRSSLSKFPANENPIAYLDLASPGPRGHYTEDGLTYGHLSQGCHPMRSLMAIRDCTVPAWWAHCPGEHARFQHIDWHKMRGARNN